LFEFQLTDGLAFGKSISMQYFAAPSLITVWFTECASTLPDVVLSELTLCHIINIRQQKTALSLHFPFIEKVELSVVDSTWAIHFYTFGL
jgi:hypothetical protein